MGAPSPASRDRSTSVENPRATSVRLYRDEPQNFGMIPALAWRDESLKPIDKVVLGALAILAMGRQCVVATFEEIGAACGLKRTSVYNACKKLEQRGIITRPTIRTNFRFEFWLKGSPKPSFEEAGTVQGCEPFRVVNGSRVRTVTVQGCEPSPLIIKREREETSSFSSREGGEIESASEARAIAELIAEARKLWPNETGLEHRVPELVARGIEQARLAVEFARLCKKDGWGYVHFTSARWQREGATLAQIEAEVARKRPLPPPNTPLEPFVSPRQIEEPVPTEEELDELLARIRNEQTPRTRKLFVALLARHVANGHAPAEWLAEIRGENGTGKEVGEKPAAGLVAKQPPPPVPENVRELLDSTVNMHSRQGIQAIQRLHEPLPASNEQVISEDNAPGRIRTYNLRIRSPLIKPNDQITPILTATLAPHDQPKSRPIHTSVSSTPRNTTVATHLSSPQEAEKPPDKRSGGFWHPTLPPDIPFHPP